MSLHDAVICVRAWKHIANYDFLRQMKDSHQLALVSCHVSVESPAD
jgi:hypothetical protein